MQEAAPDVLADVVGAEQRAGNLQAVGRAHEVVAAMWGDAWADDSDGEDDEHEPDNDTTLGVNYHRTQTSNAGVKTSAVRSGDSWVVNGVKDRVANAPLAKLFAVQASIGVCFAPDHGLDAATAAAVELTSRRPPVWEQPVWAGTSAASVR